MSTVEVVLPAGARRRLTAEPLAVAAAFALAYLIARPASADLAAQVYRTELFQDFGFTLWNGHWYAGHHTPGYSVLFPPLASVLGPRALGALAAVAAAVLFERVTYARWGARARLGAIWFGAASATNLFTGRLTFALGVAIALGAVLAAQRERPRTALALAAAAPLASPIAGLFLALVGVADGLANRRRVSLAMAAASFAVAAALAAAFPEGGVEPFVLSAYWPVVAFALAVLALAPREERAIRWGAVLYALAATAAFAIDTPMGGNATRLGTLLGGPLMACLLWRRRTLALAAVALPLLYWQWMPPVRDVAVASGDPAIRAAYYAPLNAFLERARPAGRVEIPLTRNHWETVHVARRFALARGWERQLDVKYNRLFYEPRLHPRAYRAWLAANGVQYVALPDAELDYSARAEARLIRRGLPFLEPVWRSRHWRVYRVAGAAPLVAGPARLVALRRDGFTLQAHAAGRVDVRVRYTRYWELVRGAGCVAPGRDDFTRVVLTRPGRARVAARFAPGRLVSRSPRCRAAG
jgi:hypothetical protein